MACEMWDVKCKIAIDCERFACEQVVSVWHQIFCFVAILTKMFEFFKWKPANRMQFLYKLNDDQTHLNVIVRCSVQLIVYCGLLSIINGTHNPNTTSATHMAFEMCWCYRKRGRGETKRAINVQTYEQTFTKTNKWYFDNLKTCICTIDNSMVDAKRKSQQMKFQKLSH